MTCNFVKLGKVANILSGFAFKSEWFSNRGTKVVRIGDIDNEKVDLNNCVLVNSSEYKIPASCQTQELDILMALSGATTGKIGIIDKDSHGVFVNQRIAIIRAENSITQRYLRYMFSGKILEKLLNNAWGAAQANLSPKVLRELEIPLPPLEEQRRIAAILDKADGVRRKRKAAIALTEDLLRSTFLDMFGDPVTNPKGWDAKSIESICKVVRGSSPRPKSDPRYYNGPVPRLMVADLTRDGWFVTPSIDSLTEAGAKLSRPVPKNTVVMVVSGNVGEVAKLEIDACIHDGFIGFLELKEKIVYSDYFMLVLHFMKTTHNQRTAGAIWQNLTTDGIKKMMIPLPPLSKQLEVNQLINLYQQLNTRFDSINESTENLFNSLLQRAFRGDL